MIEYRKFIYGDENEINSLIRKVYDEFIASDYSEEGNNIFYEYIEAISIKKRQNEGHILYITYDSSSIIGVMEVRNMDHISLLFVDGGYHGKGIAKGLFRNFLKEVPKEIKSVDVHASPYSIRIYEKLGFVGDGIMREENGIKYMKMQFIIK